MLIRPRAGDFNYTDAEFESMLADIRVAKKYGASGIVCGILNSNGNVDKFRMKKIIKIASPLPLTFHRAFDLTCDPFEAIYEIISLGCQRLLTSGHEATAFEGANLIKRMIRKSSDYIIIMPGSGINPSNFLKMAEITRVKEFHLSASRAFPGKMMYQKPGIAMSDENKSEYVTMQTDIEMVVNVCQIANQLKN